MSYRIALAALFEFCCNSYFCLLYVVGIYFVGTSLFSYRAAIALIRCTRWIHAPLLETMYPQCYGKSKAANMCIKSNTCRPEANTTTTWYGYAATIDWSVCLVMLLISDLGLSSVPSTSMAIMWNGGVDCILDDVIYTLANLILYFYLKGQFFLFSF